MAYCGPAGIRYSDFLGWSQLDRDAALAWQTRKQQTCEGCGTVPSDWHNTIGPDGEPAANPFAPVMHATDQYCAGCATRAAHENATKDERRPGIHTVFVPNPDAAWDFTPASTDPTET